MNLLNIQKVLLLRLIFASRMCQMTDFNVGFQEFPGERVGGWVGRHTLPGSLLISISNPCLLHSMLKLQYGCNMPCIGYSLSFKVANIL